MTEMVDKIPHGTYSGHMHHRCRCEECEPARRAYQAHVARQKAYGQWRPYGDLGRVITHLGQLRAAGWSLREIAHVSGANVTGLRKLLAGTARSVRASTERKVFSVSGPPPLVPELPALRPAIGARRRARALAALGWTGLAMAERTGLSLETVSKLIRGQGDHIRADVHARIVVLYDELAMVCPEPSLVVKRQQGRAAREGWPPPAGWDSEWLDLSEDELEAEMARLVGLMDEEERGRCVTARREGELSPLVVAAARVHRRALAVAAQERAAA